MSRRIATIQRHPGSDESPFGHALAADYRWLDGARSLKGVERNTLAFCGIGRFHDTLIGMVDASDAVRERWLEKLREMGRAGK